MAVRTVPTLSGGQWVEGAGWIDVLNPADLRSTVAQIPAMTAEQVRTTYDRAETGFAEWKRTSPFRRAEILREAAALLRARTPEIAADVVAENGKTMAEASGEVGKAADFLEYYAGLAREGYGTVLYDIRPNTRASTQREPLGVVLTITPWNDPVITPARKIAPALMCGNSVVLKPATETPLSGIHFARALHDAGIPAGVMNVVTGRTSEISDALLDDPRLAAVSFTGGNDVGGRLRVKLASRNVRFQAELGGKNATVVLADADLPAAVDGILAASFAQSGQRCTATSRLLIDRPVYDDVVKLLAERLDGLKVGNGDDPGTTMGPLVSAGHRESVLGFIDRAREEGATVVTGGQPTAGDPFAHGCFVDPTLIADVTDGMEIWREEVFGPVLAVRAISGLDEAVSAVNDSDFGLSAAIFTQSLAAAYRFIEEVDTGQVAVNTTTSGWDVHHPFGGFRQSGSPFKEQGEEALHFYTRVKAVAIRLIG